MTENLSYEVVSSSNALNIFTDASSMPFHPKYSDKELQAFCSGFLLYCGYSLIDSYYEIDRVVNDTSYAELYSIYLALQLVSNKYNNSKIIKYINIFSDSLTVVNLIRDQRKLREIITNKNMDLYRSNIPLYSLFLQVIKCITDSNMYISIYHVRGHMNGINNAVYKFRKAFSKNNGFDFDDALNEDVAEFFIDGNFIIDNYTRFHIQYQMVTFYDFYVNQYLNKHPVLYYLPNVNNYDVNKARWYIGNSCIENGVSE